MGIHAGAPRPVASLLAACLAAVVSAGVGGAARDAAERGVPPRLAAGPPGSGTQLVQTSLSREGGGDGGGGGGGVGAGALLSWLGPALLGKVSPEEVAELEKMVSGSQDLGAEALKQLQGDVKHKHPQAYAAIMSALHLSGGEAAPAVPVPRLPALALSLGRQAVAGASEAGGAPAPPEGLGTQRLRPLLVAATVLLVAMAGLASCLTEFWDGDSAYSGAVGELAPSATRLLRRQIAALSWKNAKVAWRAELPMCFSCCNGCCCMLSPIMFIGLLTVLPNFAMQATGARRMLLVEHPVEYGRNYSDASAWHHTGASLRDLLFMEPTDEGADTGWRSILQDPITTPWHPIGVLPQGACYCRTLGAVGPGASKFIEHSRQAYLDWNNRRPSQDERWRQAVKLHMASGEMWRQLRIIYGVQAQECPANDKRTFFREFSSEAEVESMLSRYNYGTVSRARAPEAEMDRLCGVVVFQNDPSTVGVVRYTIRTNVTGVDATGSVAERVVAEQQKGMQKQALGWYLQSGFLSIQELVQDFVAELRLGRGPRGPRAVFVPLPAAGYRLDKLKQSLASTVASAEVCTATFSAVVVLAAYLAIRERNSKQKELMRLMGLSDCSLALSWLLLYAFQSTLVSLGCSLLVQSVLVDNSEFFIVFLIFFLTALASSLVGLTVSALISTERLGALVAFGAYQCMGLLCHGLVRDTRQAAMSSDGSPPSSTDATSAASAHLLMASVLPNVAFVLCLKAFFALDSTPQGCTWQSLQHRVGNYTVAGGLKMLSADLLVWGLAYSYLDQVVPHGVGTTRPYNFPLTRSFWREVCGRDGRGGAPLQRGQERREDPPDEELARLPCDPEATGELFEEEDSARLQELRGSGQVVTARGLRKAFLDAAGRTVRAVNGLSLTMYAGECFCLLGHNGAGKTTTMACLTGVLAPTAGSVQVFGRRMPAELPAIRQEMSFCMQQNVLWDGLTVEEHAQLFGALMGRSRRSVRAASGRTLAQVELLHKRHAQACHLSGGMKRKLSVALALLGDSRVVILDEPTAGMDPHTRRQLWAVLKQNRAGRVLCLTTHHMDEADELGDRVCIMVHGRAACCGTSAFLKQRLGCGYLLTFVKVGESVPDGPIVSLVTAHCGEGVRTAASAGRELRVQVPFAGAPAFPGMMRELDRRLRELGAESYGVGVSDLEDVFLRVANGEAARPRAGAIPRGRPAARSAAPAGPRRDDPFHARAGVSFRRQFLGLFQRRVRYGRRDSRTFCCQLLMPTGIMVVFLTVSRAGMGDMGRYERVRVGVASSDGGRRALVSVGVSPGSDGSQRSQALARAWASSPELGELCDVRVNLSLCPPPVQGDFVNGQRNSEEIAFADYAFAFRHDGSGNSQLGGVMYAEDRVTFFPNTTSHFAGPALLDLHFRAVLQAEGGAPLRLEVSGQPLPATAQERGVIAGISGFAMGMVVFAAYSFIATGIAAYVTMEKEVEVKQQLMISGASPLAYWASNLSFDCVFGLFAFVSTMLVMAIFGVREWCSFPNIGATVALLTLFTPAVSLFAYFWSHFFNTSGNAVAGVLMLGLFLGTFGINVSETLSLFPRTRVYGYGALWIIEAVLPSACVGHGLMHLAMFRDISKAMGISPFAGFLTHTEFCSPVRGSLPCVANAGDDCIMLVFDMLLYAALVYVIEIGGLGRWLQRLPFFRDPRCPSSLQRAEGEDVCAERARVAGLDPASQVLVVNDIYKAYRGGVHAVRGITYAVGEGEVFGLLGVNGAGKTTTFRILCGQIAPSAGQVFIRGRRMADDAAGARRLIGYCPQFDALLDLLTAREHLELYAQVKGFEGPGMDAEVRQKLATVDLAGFEHSRAGQLSGGSKRKLSFALSTIGEPEIVFLDEPSAGMDPVARHFMWDVIRSIAQRRPTSAVILTTHSMDEADALCSRIAIQCLGQLRCLGSPQELKQRYGSGLELKVRLEAPRRADVEHLCAEWNGAPDTECPSPDALRLVEQRVAAACAPPTRGGSAILLGALAEWCLLQERAMAVDAFLEERCGRVGRASRVEAAGGSLRYQLVGSCLGGGPMPYAELFALLGERRRALRLADFQLSQGTLEQAFNRLAAEELEGSGLGSGNPSAARRLDGGLMPALQASKQKPS